MIEVHEHIARTDAKVHRLCERIRSAGPDARVVYDIETGCDPAMDKVFNGQGNFLAYCGAWITGMSVTVVYPYVWEAVGMEKLHGTYVPLGHEQGNVSQRARNNITEALGTTAARHVGFNTPFDWKFLLNEGLLLDVPMHAEDVQIKRWLQDENGVKKLKTLGAMWLGEDADQESRELHAMMKAPYEKITEARKAVLEAYPELGYYKGKGTVLRPDEHAEAMAQQLRKSRAWGQLTVDELGRYAARDATLTAQIDHLLDGQSPSATIEREMKVNAICIAMTRKGVSVDVDVLNAAAVKYAIREADIGAELREVHGLDNPGSSPQVAALLYDRLGLPVRGRTGSGEPSTDKNALEQLAGDPVAAKVLEYRKLNKARTAYAEAFARHAEYSQDGRIHGEYGTTRTVTGRLAASGPNVMTIPREDSLPDVRAAFNLDPARGIERIGFDLASAELWVTASITGDPVLTAILQEGRNLHTEMMLRVFGGEPDKHRREYTLSKNVNYGIEYGAGLDQITIFAAKAGYSPAEARRVAQVARDGHQRMFSVQHARAKWWSDKSQELDKLPLFPLGRYRHFRSPGKRIPGYTALNALVQGGVAEFMKDTMIELHLRGYGELLILQVHDELVFDCPTAANMAQELHEVLQRISHDINPFRFELTWEPKSWSIAS